MGAFKNAVVGATLATSVLGHSGHGRFEKRALPFAGTIYTQCVAAGTVALTFDDGPHIYTQKIVDDLTASGHKATFFQNGLNYGSIYDYGSLLASMIAGGHQVASHTWSHADLATLDAAGITDQMAQLETAHLALIGKAPVYMRPPYLSTNDLVVSTLTTLGYHIVSVDVDTFDYNEGPAGTIQNSINWFEGNVTAGGSIVLNHDPYEQTASAFVPAAIKWLDSKGLKSVPIGECLGDSDPANWYKGGSTVSSASASASASGSASASAAPSAAGNGTAKPSGLYPSISHSGTPSYPSSGAQPGKPCGGGDTEPGHGPDAGRGALPGHKGEGNKGWSGSYTATNGTSGSSGSAGTTGGAAKPSSVYTGPLSNGANALTGSVLALGAAAVVALFL